MDGRRKRYQLGKPRILHINRCEIMDGAEIKYTTNGNQNGDVQRRNGEGNQGVFLPALCVHFSYLASYSTSVSTVIFTSRAPLLWSGTI